MWVGIVGSRDFGDCDCRPSFPPSETDRSHETVCPRVRAFRLVLASVTRLAQRPDFEGIVSGGATGADTLAEQAATVLGVPTIVFPALWDRFGKGAGFRRNDDIVRRADMLLAFFSPGPLSRGTSHTVALARTKGIPVHLYHEGKWS